ncbi:hypothetical protein P4V41_20780 [Fictibacillus nanhaiensis]|uniref:hypothetical protein n=1 Tax=Fictibacillus nanhaiensis TaxID=742169 RepID=UPI002E236237|nr:hypothetical protein [Fictibacillus nanhaiensis]
MAIEANFKKHKRFLETIEIAKYNVVIHDSFYKFCVYNKFGKAKGYLALQANGTECRRDEAIDPYYLFLKFNSYLTGIVYQGREDMNKPTAVFKDTINLLEKIKPFVQSNSIHVNNAVSKITNLDNGFLRFKTLHDDALKLYDEVIKLGELEKSNVDKVDYLMNEFSIQQYKNLYLQLSMKEDFTALTQELKNYNSSGKDKENIKKALDIFSFLSGKKYIDDIYENLKQFEVDEQGNKMVFYDQSNDWEAKFIEITNKRSNKDFEIEALSMLRN